MAKKSNHDRMRDNMTSAAMGGPDYRATDSGKGEVNRSRNKRKLDLGFDLMAAAEEFGNESPEYMTILEEWRNAQS